MAGGETWLAASPEIAGVRGTPSSPICKPERVRGSERTSGAGNHPGPELAGDLLISLVASRLVEGSRGTDVPRSGICDDERSIPEPNLRSNTRSSHDRDLPAPFTMNAPCRQGEGLGSRSHCGRPAPRYETHGESLMSEKDRHVVPNKGGGYNVRKPGASRPSSNHPTQKEATQQARKTTARTKGETVIHGKDGRIRQKDTARGGNDPNPPRDKR